VCEIELVFARAHNLIANTVCTAANLIVELVYYGLEMSSLYTRYKSLTNIINNLKCESSILDAT
jgi:hypothetical protein